VLAFWFGAPDSAEYGKSSAKWFAKDDRFDAEIRERFGDRVAQALSGGLSDWPDQPPGALAYVILLDQFTRNIHRGAPLAFAGDARALAAAKSIVARGWDLEWPSVQRWFCYLPFEHAESLPEQDESLRLFGLLREDPIAGGAYEWAVRHREVILRFGRYPHRNAILGRTSSAAERVFLALPGSGF
jgi:uncharacterized protein (DUF924 family)